MVGGAAAHFAAALLNQLDAAFYDSSFVGMFVFDEPGVINRGHSISKLALCSEVNEFEEGDLFGMINDEQDWLVSVAAEGSGIHGSGRWCVPFGQAVDLDWIARAIWPELVLFDDWSQVIEFGVVESEMM